MTDKTNHSFMSLLQAAGVELTKPDMVMTELIEHLKNLLDNDLNRLYALLYRIDIPEKKAAKAFDGKQSREIAEQLAEMIRLRLLEKIKSREEFRKTKD